MPQTYNCGYTKDINADNVFTFHKGYALTNLPQKEDDLYHLLNFACLKLTGQQLPADGLPENLWRYVHSGCPHEWRRGISPTYPAETIMRPSYFSDLSFAVKRALICDEIKCIQYNTEKMPTMFKEINEAGYKIKREDGHHNFGTHEWGDTYDNTAPYAQRRCDKDIIAFLKDKSYDCLIGTEGSDKLIDIIKNSKKKASPYPDDPLRSSEWRIRSQHIGKIFQNSSYAQRRFNGAEPNVNGIINASKRIDGMLLNSMKAREGVGKEYTITRQGKIRKGHEYKMFETMMKCLPYVWAGEWSSALSQQVIQHHFALRTLFKNSVRGYGIGFQSSGMRVNGANAKDDYCKLGWDKYKKASGNLSSNDLIRVLCGKKGYTDDISIKDKMVKQFC